MNRMIKQMTSMLLVGTMALGLSACGSNPNQAVTSSSSTSSKGETDWPKKTVNIVVPYSAGGDSDFNARTMAEQLSKEWGVSVVVSNVTGSGGSIASNQVKNAANDGYTILSNHASLNMNTASGTIDWDYSDLQMGCVYAIGQPEAVIVRGDAPWNSIEDLIEDSKSKPGEIIASGATGAITQWAPIALNRAGAALNIVDVGSTSDRIPALLGGHVDVIVASMSTVKDYLATGEFRALAVCGTERSETYPDVPTMTEAGVDCGYLMSYTFFFPAGTDEKIVKKLESTVQKIVDNNTDYADSIAEAYDQVPTCMTTEESTTYYGEMLDNLMNISDVLQGKA